MRRAILCAAIVVLFVGGRRLLLEAPSPTVQTAEQHTGASGKVLDGAPNARGATTTPAAATRGPNHPSAWARAEGHGVAPAQSIADQVPTWVLVRDAQGAAMIGAEAHVHGLLELDSGRARAIGGVTGAPLALGRTDGNGALEFSLAGAAALVVTDTSGRTGAVRVVAGQTSTLVLNGPARTLTIVDNATGAAVIARDFPLVWSAGPLRVAYFVRTDERGVVALPVGQGFLELYKSEPQVVFASLAVDGVETDFAGHPDALRLALESEARHLAVRASLEERTLRLVDSSTGRPVSGTAFAQLQYLDASKESWRGVPATTAYPVRDGALVIGSWFTDPQPWNRVASTRRWLAVGGYETQYLEPETDLDGRELYLAPGASRWLRALDAAGEPIHAPLRVTFGEGVTLSLEPDATGLVGPLSWSQGDDWTVVCSRYAPEESTLQISAERLAATETIALRPRAQSARLTVTGIPPGAPPLFAIERHGESWKGTRKETVEVFNGLPSGDYAVGPQNWARQVQLTAKSTQEGEGVSVTPLDVALEAGSTQSISWNPDWWVETPSTGRVMCDGLASESIAVLPVYAARERTLDFGPRAEWLHVERDGAFNLQAGAPRPWALLFARFGADAFGQQVVPLACQPVRGDGEYRVVLTSVELITSNADELPEGLSVRVDPVGLGLRAAAPMRYSSGLWPRQWDPRTTFCWDGLGTQIEALRLTGSAFPEAVRVDLTPGTHNRLEVSVPVTNTGAAPRENAPVLR